ncbi:hypothetical protein GUITHDRAFT_120641 [Guillardia theta CCMP2712]|uniref:Uncharacterized protein n=1 Tax=Guillardia theta (strain CCMP2712) TaxID=905079 RepID=L1IAR9_GUITC|nr:hypothetical protein GUITHDRAFT_120641 [Guillardia theta CCMP2712]EKX33197.1 hypothetical protein GUITHDRAFT_120641 [Guillardia theta CCMP2712]|eukprot:XP_005820177.1 hypothetical protein GUITHDRAFT_120641 [Guillardia theta CCMP2712]
MINKYIKDSSYSVDEERIGSSGKYSRVSGKGKYSKYAPGLNSLSDAETQGQESDSITSHESKSNIQRMDLSTFERMMSATDMMQSWTSSHSCPATPDHETVPVRPVQRANSLIVISKTTHNSGHVSEVGKLQIFSQRRASMRNVLQGYQTSSLISSESESMRTIGSSSSEGGPLQRAKIDLDLAAAHPERKGGWTSDEDKITIEAQAKSNRSHVDDSASESSRQARGIKERKEQESVVKRATFSESNLSELRKARKASLQVISREREDVKNNHQDMMRRRSEMDISDRSRGLSAANVGGQESNVNPSERSPFPDEIDIVMGTSRVARKPKDGRQQERGERREANGERRLSEGAKMQAQQWWRARVKSIAKMDDDDEDL